MFRKLWSDDAGVVVLEYLLLATVLTIALVVGIANVTGALNAELSELANAILGLNQSYSYEAQSGCKATHGGTTMTDSIGTVSYGSSAAVTPTVTTGSVDINGCP